MTAIPADPLTRFLELAQAFGEEKSWWEDRSIVRYAALPLVTADGDPTTLARKAMAAAKVIAKEASWGSDLRSSLRHVLAAFVAAAGHDPVDFGSACAEIRTRFRAAGVRRGSGYEAIAAAMLHVAGADRDADVRRLQQIYETMKQHHWWLTGPDDLPACALLTVHGDAPQAMPSRIEGVYERLRAAGLSPGSGLQLASHVLYLAPGSVAEVSERFLRLHHGFRAADIAMWDCDRDELAILCLLADDPARTIATVVDHRARIRGTLRHVGPTTSFSYACGTAFFAALRGRPSDATLLRNVTAANLVMATNAASLLQQQRAAAASAAT